MGNTDGGGFQVLLNQLAAQETVLDTAAGAISVTVAAAAAEVLVPALALFAGALAVAWLGIYFFKMYTALQALNHLRSKGHAPGSPA